MTPRPFKDWAAAIIWLSAILILGWLPTQSDFHIILPSILAAFTSFVFLVYYSKLPVKWLIAIAIVARILIIPAFPNLSDDIYRFIWDGRLWHEGMNAFMMLPSDLVGQQPVLTEGLYNKLNSQQYYSIYPPVAQFIFWISTFARSLDFQMEAIIMKSIHCAFDLATICIIWKLLLHFKMDNRKILLYALNPLIIIELIGNLHHEGIVIFFLMLMLLLIVKKRISMAGLAMGGAIATKILPLLFCPLLFFYFKGKQRWIFTLTTIATCLLVFLPLLWHPEIVSNLGNSADLYLRKFEFNGGIYYLYRAFGYVLYGYNMIHIVGPILMSTAALGIFYIALTYSRRSISYQQLIMLLIMTYASYISLSITVHPWYIAILIPLCLFTPYRTPILWSGLIMLTYINYSFESYHEVLAIVAVEYIAVFGLLIYEVRRYGLSVA